MAPIPMRRGGRVLADALVAQGIDHAFCVPGESYLDVLDGLHGRDDIRLVTCRHEAGAVHMADACARLTGRLAAALVTRGPGACHAAIGVHVAAQDSTPLLLVVGQIPFAETDRESFQEIDYRRMFGGVAKWVTQIDDAARIPELIAHAADVATSGRRGPVVVALSEEMQRHQVAVADIGPAEVFRPLPDPTAVARLLALLARAQRPVAILGGRFSERGRADLGAFLRAHEISTTVAFRRQALVDGTASNYAGDLGVGSDPGLVAHVRDADLVLALGTRLGEAVSQGYTLFPPKQALVHAHAEAAEIGRVFRPTLGIAGDMDALAAMLAAAPVPASVPWSGWTARLRATRLAQAVPPDYPGKLNLGVVLNQLQGLLADDAILTCDAGNFATWPPRFLQFGDRQRFIGTTCGAMGYAVPAAVGAAIAHPGRQVVAFVGDGGMLMTGQEIATAFLHGAAPIVVVFDNAMYGTIRMYQEREYPGRVSGTALKNPDFARWMEAFGGHGETVAATAEFAPAWHRAVASRRPALIWLRTDPEQITSRSTIAALRGG